MTTGWKKYLRTSQAGILLFGGVLTASLLEGVRPASAAPTASLYVAVGGTGDCTMAAKACGSIQTAINTATGGSYAGDDVTINVAAGTYTENDTIDAGTLNSLTIAGAGASTTTASAPSGLGTVFTVNNGTVIISGLTVTNGDTSGIVNGGTLTINSSTVSGNTSTTFADGAVVGGGIVNGGTMTINSSTVSGNKATLVNGLGGGIFNGGTLTLNSSTVSSNTATAGAGVFNGGTLTLNSSTVSSNTAAAVGGGIVSEAGSITLGATIVAANTASTGGNCSANGGSFTVTSLGYNLTDDPSTANTCDLTAATDVLGANPELSPLGYYGGPTETQLPAAGSPAIGVIPNPTTLSNGVTACPRTDQRGQASVGNCTIGAVEVGSTLIVTDCSGSPTDTGSLPFTVANAAAGDTITFATGLSCPPSSPILLTSPIDIGQDLTITGPGPSTMAVSGGDTVQVLVVNSSTVIISGLTIENGTEAVSVGGGIDNDLGTLTLNSSTVSGNTAEGHAGGAGGGIFNGGTMTINSSTVSGNTAPNGTGGGINNGATMTINSSTVSGNTANGDLEFGGGGIYNQGTLTVTSSTVSNNSATDGGGIDNAAGSSTLRATIVSENSGVNCANSGGSITSLGYNLTNDATGTDCGFTAQGDVVDAKPGLGPLTDNGGPTLTQLPAANGPAVGVIPAGTKLDGVKVCPRIDQRGVASIGKCTIGAVEQHGVWQSQVQGYPAFPVKDSPPPGFLIGVQDGIWKLYSHNLTGVDIFTGTITTNGTFSDVALTSNDSGDKMTMLNPQTISFGFHTAGYVSGIKFVSSGSQVTFHNLEEDGTLVPPADILLGNAETSATSNPLTITRP